MNLIFNSVDAIENQGIINISCYQEHDQVLLVIEDNGKGMTEKQKSRCTEPFFTTKDIHNSGLGLSMVKSIVEKHSGEMNIESSPNLGTKFLISFPAITTNTTVDKIQDSPYQKSQRPLSIFAVDDDQVNLNILQEILTAAGHKVTIASNGQEALNLLPSNIDLIITDLAMPKMNGNVFASKVREQRPSLPIILLSAQVNVSDQVTTNAPLFDVILSKPIRSQKLLKSIDKIEIQRENR